jgi:hydroxyacylglutathione hydrolase
MVGMIIETFVQTPFQQNTRVLACEETRKAICIDPGERSETLVSFVRERGLDLQAITLTHGHLDHVGGTTAVRESFPEAEVILHADDEDLYYGLPQQPLFMGIQPHQMAALGLAYAEPPKLTRNWSDGELYEVGELRFRVLHCPGHTRGHVVLAEEREKKVFVGDCLFAGSIGRTDLPGGSYEQLIDSITRNILALGDDFTVYSGHGPETTVGDERRTNPFLNGLYQSGKGRYI